MKRFQHIDTWIFDLDNTLYPASCRLFDQMHVKMGNYVMQRFGVDQAEAKRIQKTLFQKHGTTLRGLMVEHGEKPEAFLAQVHDIDYTAVKAAPALRAAITALPGRKFIFTNGTSHHARRTTDRLGITDLFEATFDIIDADYVPKPDVAPYHRFNTQHTIAPGSSAFFEDIAHNLKVPHQLGMQTVLVESIESAHLNDHHIADYVQHTTSDLAGFLARIM
jgi:putative hydrolase of the HAD superfamily